MRRIVRFILGIHSTPVLRGFTTVCGQVAWDEPHRQLPHTVANPRNGSPEEGTDMLRQLRASVSLAKRVVNIPEWSS